MAIEKDSETHRIDDILRYVGEFGLWQKFLYFSSCFLVIVPSAIQIASLVFATGTPKFHCVTPNVTCEESKCCDNCTTYAFDKSFTSTVTEVSFDRRVNLQFLQIDHWGKGREACIVLPIDVRRLGVSSTETDADRCAYRDQHKRQ